MAISSISSSSAVPNSNVQNGIQQRRSEFKQLSQALKSGDLSAAQSAFDSLTQNSNSQTSADPNSAVAQDFAAVGKAIQSGDLSGAQQAFAKLQKDVSSASSSGSAQAPTQQSHRGHHGHHHIDSDDTASSLSQGSTSTTGSIINLTA